MYFNDRMTLGNSLADRVMGVRATDAIIVCLKQSSLMVAIAMAIKLRAWILPLFYEKLPNPMEPGKDLGAVIPTGEFCLHPDITTYDFEYIQQEFMAQIEDEKREAMSRLNQAINQYRGTSDPHILNNRNVILAGDVMMNSLELEIANSIMKPLSPLCVYATVGNVTIDVSDQFRLQTNEAHILDILASSVMGEDHYFENQDAYSISEKQLLALNIAQYWT